jgi:hypothetical protein
MAQDELRDIARAQVFEENRAVPKAVEEKLVDNGKLMQQR